jgi:hypothetical protein
MAAGQTATDEGRDFVAVLAEHHRAATFVGNAIGHIVAGTSP